jgi:single-strand DNA-binding protein
MFNQVTLVGNLGDAPTMRYTPSGVAVTSFPLAVNETWVNASGEKQTKTIWLRVSCWRKQAETVSQYLTKGSKVLVIGQIDQVRAYANKDGTPGASLEITANTVKFLDSKGDREAGAQPFTKEAVEEMLPASLDTLESIPF